MTNNLNPVTLLEGLDRYDAGYLGDGGGGNVGWWWDYMRSELDRAHDFYAEQLDALLARRVIVLEEAIQKISSQAICHGMAAEETELRDWLRFISETAEAALTNKDEPK